MGRASPRRDDPYSLEFKRQAVKLSQLKGVEVQAVATREEGENSQHEGKPP